MSANTSEWVNMTSRKIKNIALIGSGTMAPGIAHSFAKCGYTVRLLYRREEAAQKVRAVMASNLATLAQHGLLDAAKIPEIQGRVQLTKSMEAAVEDAQLVLECIYEKLEAKRELFKQLDNISGPDTIWASNTSYLNIFDLVPARRLPFTCVTHWFAPPHILPLVEVVSPSTTSGMTEQIVLDLHKEIGKVPVLMKRFVPGHAINRLLRIIGREVFFLLDNGYMTADQLDLAVKASIAPRMMLLGVVQRYDFTGLELSAGNLQNDAFVEPPLDNEPKSLFDLVKRGDWGVKSGKGFFDYSGRTLTSVLAERDDGLIRLLKSSSFCLSSRVGEPPSQAGGLGTSCEGTTDLAHRG